VNSADTKVGAEGRQEVLQAPEERFPAAHEADHGGTGCPCSQEGPRGNRSPPTARGGPQARAGGYPKEAGTLWEGPTLEQFVQSCSPWKDPLLEQPMEDCLLWEGPNSGAGQRVRSPPLRRMEQQRLQPPLPIPLHRSGRGGRENWA